jgi:hypothetical protein
MRYDSRDFGRRGRGPRTEYPGSNPEHQDRGGGRRDDVAGTGYGGDYWWLGERELRRRGFASRYDSRYRDGPGAYRPRFSPVGGMYGPVGGMSARGRPPRPLAEPTRFSEWTRWF